MIFFCLLSFKFSSIFWISAINFSAVEIQMMKNSWQQNYNYHCFGIPRHVLSVTKHYISNSSWLSQNAGNGFSFSPYSLMDAFHSVIQPLESQCMVSWGRDEESEAEQSQRSEVMWCALTRFTAGGRGRKEGAAQENRALRLVCGWTLVLTNESMVNIWQRWCQPLAETFTSALLCERETRRGN